MTSKQRLLCALDLGKPDRLPVTTHHVMDYFLSKCMNGASVPEFFDRFGLDPIYWLNVHQPDQAAGEYYDPLQKSPGFLESRRISSDQWRIFEEELPGQ